ncbi:hypothetical protein CIB48_g124 [Xylaria polymorpha]|nr:hypothetical protein CIB48_g124 [Xylaria polymorpha]
MTTIAVSSLPFPQEANSILAEQLKTHVWRKFRYVLTEDDIEEIIFTDMWPSIEVFIEYMTQDCVGVGEVIPGTINRKPPPTARIYASAELDAMDAGVLPLDYGLLHPRIEELGLDDDDDDDDDDASILTNYDGEPLPLYNGDKLPIYRPPSASPPEYHGAYFDPNEDVWWPGDSIIESLKDLPGITVAQETTTDSTRRSKHNPFSKLRPRLTAGIQKLKEKFPRLKKKTGRTEDHPKDAREPLSKRVRKKIADFNALETVSPKRAVKRARRFITLGRYQV